MEQFTNDFATTLAAAITGVGDLTLTVASSTGAPTANFRIRIDNEIILVTAVAHPTWTISRGIEGTTAATHLLGADVVHVLTYGGLDQFLVERGWLFEELEIPAGATKTVAAGRRWMVDGDLEVLGTLDLFGAVKI